MKENVQTFADFLFQDDITSEISSDYSIVWPSALGR